MDGFYVRVCSILNERNLSRAAFCRLHQIKESSLKHYWKTDKLPQGEDLKKICQGLEVSADYLLFGTEGCKSDDPILQQIMEILNNNTRDDKLEILGMLKSIAHLHLPSDEEVTKFTREFLSTSSDT